MDKVKRKLKFHVNFTKQFFVQCYKVIVYPILIIKNFWTAYIFNNKDVCQLFIDFEKAYDSIKRESLYDILIKFGVPKQLVRLIKIC